MMTNEPLISVVIPAYNAAAFIKKAINSVLTQSYKHLEIIIVNDGSIDKTTDIVNALSDKRIKLISQSNMGLSNARNTGIKASKGEYIAFLDADDYWKPEKLEKQLKLLTQHPEIGFCSTQTRVETPEGQFINDWLCPDISISTLHSIFIQNAAITGSGSGVLVKKELQDLAGFFDESLKSLEDIDMWLRYAAHSEYCCLPESLTVITKQPESMSCNLNTMRESAVKVLRNNKKLLDKPLQKEFWRSCYATMLCDYAKWEARSGRKITAITHLLEALIYSPLNKGRLSIGLLLAILLNKPLR